MQGKVARLIKYDKISPDSHSGQLLSGRRRLGYGELIEESPNTAPHVRGEW